MLVLGGLYYFFVHRHMKIKIVGQASCLSPFFVLPQPHFQHFASTSLALNRNRTRKSRRGRQTPANSMRRLFGFTGNRKQPRGFAGQKRKPPPKLSERVMPSPVAFSNASLRVPRLKKAAGFSAFETFLK